MKKAIALATLLILTGCGKAGSPVVPGSSFPHPYPDPKLSPSAPVKAPAPEDQPGLQADPGKDKFSAQGSYIDPAVRSTELQRAAISPGVTLPYTQTQSNGSATPFNSTLGTSAGSPLAPYPGTAPTDDEQPPQ